MKKSFRDKFKGAFQPVDYAGWEIVFMRVFFAIAAWYAFQKIQTFPEPRYEIGIGHWIPLSIFHDPEPLFPSISASQSSSDWIFALCMLAYVFGFFPSVALPIAAFLFIGAGTLNTSQGKIHHHLQAGAAVLSVLAAWHVIAAVIRKWKPHRLTRLRTFQLSVFFVLQTVAAAYVVSAVTKLETSGLAWFTDTKYAPVAIRKTEDSSYFSTLEVRNPLAPAEAEDGEEATSQPQFGAAIPRAIQRVIIEHPWSGAWILGPGLIIELFAFLALIGRRWAFAVGMTFITFHFLVGQIMDLHFQFNNHILIIFFLNIPFWIALLWNKCTNPNKLTRPQVT